LQVRAYDFLIKEWVVRIISKQESMTELWEIFLLKSGKTVTATESGPSFRCTLMAARIRLADVA